MFDIPLEIFLYHVDCYVLDACWQLGQTNFFGVPAGSVL